MKRFLLIPLSFIIISCKTVSYTNYIYDVSLIEPISSKGLEYKDKFIDIKFSTVTNRINFELVNKSDKIIKINWDELSIVLNDKAGRVIHHGVKLVDKDREQVPTIIPKNSYWADEIIPVNNIYYQDAPVGTLAQRASGWRTSSLLIQKSYSKTDNYIESYIGKNFSLYFPIYYENEKLEYYFVFKINNIEMSRYKKKEIRTNENAKL